MPRFAVVPVAGALGPDHVRGHFQRDLAVGRPAAVADLRAGVLDGDVVAEEPRPLAGACVIRVFCWLSSMPRVSRRNSASLALISPASAFGPVNPSMWSAVVPFVFSRR